ncbi:class I SAM-dependent methyltransferase [Pendulispora brunnea]|uniref:Class I SAM-dependent methyltransferase n=1 Tax=Pendulispora brunnea TaxID=2905690 RepID=A0ABZ2KG70_9BACT
MLPTRTPELERLRAIQRHVDAYTVGILDALPITASWDCLELGAGAGSIAHWMAERCPRGRVVAVDIDVRHLDANGAANLVIEQADVTRTDYAPGMYDLVHARYLFCHLAQREDVLLRAARWLKPGGYLFIEEPYQLPSETSPFPRVRRVMDAYERYHATRGTDLKWARGLPAALARAGLGEVMHAGNLGCMGGGSRDRWSPLIANAGPALVAEGLLSEADLEGFFELVADPCFIDIPQVTIAAWGRAKLA